MKWLRDNTRRFAERPHWEPAELDAECEEVVTEYFVRKHGTVFYPLPTDELTNLIEERAESFDLYADLSEEGDDVEGVTDFFPGKKPVVRISHLLSNNPRMSNRLRTTLTHELGHVVLHSFLYDTKAATGNLFGAVEGTPNKCKRDKILGANQADWMEWQAGFACGAFLMPSTGLLEAIRGFLTGRSLGATTFTVVSTEGQALVDAVATRFEVSREAARVRLEQRGVLGERAPNALF